MKKIFPLRLEELRGGKSQKEFAHQLGLHVNTYSNWIREIRSPTAEAVADEVATSMGHAGTGIFFRHYRALAHPGDGKKFFAIRPKVTHG